MSPTEAFILPFAYVACKHDNFILYKMFNFPQLSKPDFEWPYVSELYHIFIVLEQSSIYGGS